MANKEKIDYLLLDIRELETQIAGMRNAEVYPVSFFSQTFDLTHKILKELHALEATQIETLRRQMEAHQAVLQSIPECSNPSRSRLRNQLKRDGSRKKSFGNRKKRNKSRLRLFRTPSPNRKRNNRKRLPRPNNLKPSRRDSPHVR